MSSENSESPDRPTGVAGDENYSHQRRQQMIEDSRERCIEIRTEARSQQIAGQLGETKARQHYRGAVESYLLQIIPLLERDDATVDGEYLDAGEEPLGQIAFQPPADLVAFAKDNLIRLADGSQVPQASSVTIGGFKDLLKMPSPISVSWTVVVDSGSVERRSESVVKEVPIRVLDETVQQADAALDELDIGIELSEKEQEWEI